MTNPQFCVCPEPAPCEYGIKHNDPKCLNCGLPLPPKEKKIDLLKQFMDRAKLPDPFTPETSQEKPCLACEAYHTCERGNWTPPSWEERFDKEFPGIQITTYLSNSAIFTHGTPEEIKAFISSEKEASYQEGAKAGYRAGQDGPRAARAERERIEKLIKKMRLVMDNKGRRYMDDLLAALSNQKEYE